MNLLEDFRERLVEACVSDVERRAIEIAWDGICGGLRESLEEGFRYE